MQQKIPFTFHFNTRHITTTGCLCAVLIIIGIFMNITFETKVIFEFATGFFWACAY